jgi:ISXO2 transposase-like protein
MLLVAAAEVVSRPNDRLALGRIRLAPIADYSAKNCTPSSRLTSRRARLKSDGWSGYPGAPGVDHHPHTVGAMAAHVLLPAVHRVISNLKRWALGVYHGLRPKHLAAYFEEFVFRFNRRKNRHAAFATLKASGSAG